MADRLKRRTAATTAKTGRLPRRTSLGAYLGGDEAAEAEYAYQRLQEAFAEPLGLPWYSEGRDGADTVPVNVPIGYGSKQPDNSGELLGQSRGLPTSPVRAAVSPALSGYHPAGKVEGQTGEMSVYNPSLREQYVELMQRVLLATGIHDDSYWAQRSAQGLVSLSEFSPLGVLTAADDVRRAYNRGDYRGTGLAALGAIPMFGKARGPIKEAVEGAEAVARKWEPTIFKEVEKLPEVPQVDLPRYVPPRGMSPRVLDMVQNPTVRDKVLEFAERGTPMGGLAWHETNPLRHLYWREVKPDAGDKDLRLFANLLGATSPLSDVPTNIRLASYYYHLIKTGRQAEMALRNPFPWGHKLERVHKRNVYRVLDGDGALDPMRNPKGASMAANVGGNLQPTQVDSKIYRLLTMPTEDPRWLRSSYRLGKDGHILYPRRMVEQGEVSFDEALSNPSWWLSQPQRNEYRAFEQYLQTLSRELGVPPAGFEGAVWVGGGPLAGLRTDPWKPLLGHLEDRAHANAFVRGISPEEVIRDSIIRGKFALRSLAGIGLGAAGGSVVVGAKEHNDRKKRQSRESTL